MRALPFLVALALAPSAAAIYGGAEVAPGTYPWMVEMHWADGTHTCGGLLVAPTLVLSAAHCTPSEADAAFASQGLSAPGVVWGSTWDSTVAVIGATDLDANDGEVIGIAAWHRHPLYHVPAYFTNDVSIIELAAPSTKALVAFATPDDLALYPAGTPARVIGWGCTETTCAQRHLLETIAPVHDDADCKSRANYAVQFDPATMVCAGSPGFDSCGGDSGGPLFVEKNGQPLAIGIVSFGPVVEVDAAGPTVTPAPCGGQDPGVYTEIAGFRDFIEGFVG